MLSEELVRARYEVAIQSLDDTMKWIGLSCENYSIAASERYKVVYGNLVAYSQVLELDVPEKYTNFWNGLKLHELNRELAHNKLILHVMEMEE